MMALWCTYANNTIPYVTVDETSKSELNCLIIKFSTRLAVVSIRVCLYCQLSDFLTYHALWSFILCKRGYGRRYKHRHITRN